MKELVKIYNYGEKIPTTELSEILPVWSVKKIAHMKKKLNNPNSFINKLIKHDGKKRNNYTNSETA